MFYTPSGYTTFSLRKLKFYEGRGLGVNWVASPDVTFRHGKLTEFWFY